MYYRAVAVSRLNLIVYHKIKQNNRFGKEMSLSIQIYRTSNMIDPNPEPLAP